MSNLKTNKSLRDAWKEEAEKVRIACENAINGTSMSSPSYGQEIKTILYFGTLGDKIKKLIHDIEILEEELKDKNEKSN